MNPYRSTILSIAVLCGACGGPEQPVPAVQPAVLSPEQVQEPIEALPPETDLPPMAAGTWSLACGAALELVASGPLQLVEPAGLRPLGGQAVGEPAVDQARERVAWSQAPMAL